MKFNLMFNEFDEDKLCGLTCTFKDWTGHSVYLELELEWFIFIVIGYNYI